MRRVVTIDGPAGSGKSTVARQVAERLGWRLLDTGAMFRAVAWAVARAGLDLDDAQAVARLTETLEVRFPPGRVLVDGEDVTEAIRTSEVTRRVRPIADNPAVRRELAGWQRAFAAENDTVTEGRDQGTVVFPDAPLKFFLTADPAERARRRFEEFRRRGETVAYDEVFADLQRRDREDEARTIAPLKPAEDAQRLDTTGRTIDEVVTIIERSARRLADASEPLTEPAER